MPARVTVKTKDGREFTQTVLYPKGNPQNRHTEEEFHGKYFDMAHRVLGDQQAEELYQRCRDLPNLEDVAELAPLYGPRAEPRFRRHVARPRRPPNRHCEVHTAWE